ncbi:kinase-like domain-containing protein [Rhizophagus diaphanus]|nr:kinase-like domain-containing protein [Rhizophagus diaphanus] [Rhizophagus sp. MUCL 43196]
MEDLEKRREVYGICGECNEPGTGKEWCQPCNAKRFKKNFKNWFSGNKKIDELIQQSQLNAVHYTKCLEWIPYENFKNVTYITRGGFSHIYSADWPGYIRYWDIENQNWKRTSEKVVLKILNKSFNAITDFLDEVKSHLEIYISNIIQCYGITQDPKTSNYVMILEYCENGNLNDYLNENYIDYGLKIDHLLQISRGILYIHNAGKVHRDLHPGNILFNNTPYISDFGMCKSAKNENKEKIYGILPYVAPEVIHDSKYTKAADIYSFGIIMNEFLSEIPPYNNTNHDKLLAMDIHEGLRPTISEDTPELLADLIIKCWDDKTENRPTAKELYQILNTWNREKYKKYSEIYSQIKNCENIRKKNKLKTKSKSSNAQTYTYKSNENKPRNRKSTCSTYYSRSIYYSRKTPVISANSLHSMASALSCQL